jgi:uncharacterized repeat protein (TIGR01451 family)
MSSASSVLKNSLKSIDLLILVALGLSTLFAPKSTEESMQPAPDVRVLMFDSPTVVDVGSNLTYLIEVTNIGDLPATGVTLTDTLPPDVTFAFANSTVGTCSGTTSIICNIGTLNVGATAKVTIVVTSFAQSTIINTATATLNEADSFLANNAATTNTLVNILTTITGHVKDNFGNPIAGLRLDVLGIALQDVAFTDTNGFYSFSHIQKNASYTVTPDPFTLYDFAPSKQIIENLTTSVVVDFVGTKQPANVISGRVIEASTGQGLPFVHVDLKQGPVRIDFQSTDANGNFNFGERKRNNSYAVSIDDGIRFDGIGFVMFIYGPKTSPNAQLAEIQIPLLTSDQNLTFTAARVNTVQSAVAATSVNEESGFVEIVVTRAGDVTSPANVNFATADTAGLAACSVANGKASERCDYGSTVGTLRFAAGEASKSIFVPVVNDVNLEGDETFTLALLSPIGAQMGSIPNVTVTINDNDTAPAAQNPIDGVDPFVTQQYIDFLGRLPDSIGLANWVATLNGCPNSGFGENDNPNCDRVHVSAGFFLSAEFRGRGYFAYRFYEVAFDRRPLYAEFVPDMAQVGGAQSPQSELLSKAAYTDAFVQRSEFTNRYNSLTNAAYVNALEQNGEITIANKADLIAALDGNQKTRGQVLREIVESKAVEDKFFIRAFVAMQYFGYLRRDPDTIGYNNWVTTLTNDPSNFRHMIFGFLFSNEYRGRFGS